MKNVTSRRAAALAAATLGLVVVAVPTAKAELPGSLVPILRDSHVEEAGLCSPGDKPETGLQGDVPKPDQASGRAKLGYNCGVSLVGHSALDTEGRATGNANMAWAGDCAYVAGDGIAVVDVSEPAVPRHVRTLRSSATAASVETLHAVETPERAILVAGRYGIGTPVKDVPMDVYDVSDCANPVLLETVVWPENIHNLTISGNGRYVFATTPLQVVDLDPLFDADPATKSRFLGNLSNDLVYPLVPLGPGADLDDPLPEEIRDARKGGLGAIDGHEAWPNDEGTKLYLGGVTPQSEVFTIVDISQWLQRDAAGAAAGPPKVISQRTGRGHSIRTGTVRQNGTVRRLVLHSEEAVFGTAKGCLPEVLNPMAGPAEPWLTDITDEANPGPTQQFGLEINKAENCLTQLASGVDASAHYNDFDSATDTHFAMVSMWHAGVRVFDVRNPERPVEVAYLNPADVGVGEVVLDQAWGHVRYVPETGHIWFATKTGGFWVVEIAPQVRDHLGLDKKSPRPKVQHPKGKPGTAGVLRPKAAVFDPTPYYCTLGSVVPAVPLP